MNRNTSPPNRPTAKFYTIEDVADSLDVSTRTVRRWVKSGALVTHRFGHLTRISEADFATFLAAKRSVTLMSTAGN
jgi:excisionase family DNA binding protein